MSRSYHYHRYLSAVALLGAASGLVLCGMARQRRLQPARPYGCCTAQQILDRAEPLCHLLMPRAGRLTLAANHSTVDTLAPTWDVTCTDPDGTECLYLTWSAKTGQLCCVALKPSRAPSKMGRPLTNSEAVEVTWRWLRALGMVGQDSHWQLVSAPTRTWGNWTICWQCPDCRAEIQINGHTRDLITVRCFPKPMVNERPVPAGGSR